MYLSDLKKLLNNTMDKFGNIQVVKVTENEVDETTELLYIPECDGVVIE